MSPILDIQYRLRELGRIRLGAKSEKGAPTKLKHWRLTSASEDLLTKAAELYGGEVREWEGAPNDGKQFELFTEADTLEIVVPPNDTAFSQWMETWSGGGCQKRCDGRQQVLVDRPCSCPKDPEERNELAKQGKACKPTTRFNVLLPDIPDVGVWRMETHGFYAAIELAAFEQIAQLATSQGQMIKARLRIDQRTSKKNGQTRRYIVPVVEISHTVGDVLQAMGASVDAVAFSLPAPVEGRSLPGARPELPAQAAPWSPEELDAPEPPPVDWLAQLRGRFSDNVIIAVAEQVRAELGVGSPIGSIDGVAKAEAIGAHVTIIERLNNQGPKGEQGSSSTEAGANSAAVDVEVEPTGVNMGTPASAPQGEEEPSSATTSPTSQNGTEQASSSSGADSADVEGGPEGSLDDPDNGSSAAKEPDGPPLDEEQRSRLLQMIELAIESKMKLGRNLITEARVHMHAIVVQDSGDKAFNDYADFVERASGEIVAKVAEHFDLPGRMAEAV